MLERPRGNPGGGTVSPSGQTRSPERLRAHYEIERELSDRLREGSFADRSRLYTEVYEELFARVPDHPQLTWAEDEAERRETVAKQLRMLAPFLGGSPVFLEIGAGDCALSAAVAERTGAPVHAVDVSPTIVNLTDLPAGVEVHLSDGREIPAPPGSVDVAYSNQLLEHLHPDDALTQTRNVFEALRPGGVYVCLTPNRLTGPHDISMFLRPGPARLSPARVHDHRASRAVRRGGIQQGVRHRSTGRAGPRPSGLDPERAGAHPLCIAGRGRPAACAGDPDRPALRPSGRGAVAQMAGDLEQLPVFDVRVSEEDVRAVEEALRSGWLTMGERTEQFEREFAESVGVGHAVAVSSCTAALHLACLAADIGPGDEVIVPSMTFVATANAVRYTGATPIFADVVSEGRPGNGRRPRRVADRRADQGCDPGALRGLRGRDRSAGQAL